MTEGLSKGICKALARGRTTGNYELTAKGLTQVPQALYNHEVQLPDSQDVNWWEYTEPCRVQLSRNSLTRVPIELFMMQTVSVLDLSHNELAAALSNDIGLMRNLRSLLLSHCCLNELPAAVGTLEFLARLDVSHNRLCSLPQLGAQQPLAELLASHNQLSALPNTLACSTLSSLDVSHNELVELPDGLWQATNLQSLDLSYNSIGGSLSEELANLKRLVTLNLRQNQLTALPAGIGGCTCLIELHVGRNGLRQLPQKLSRLSKLRLLDAASNYLTAYPQAACSLKLNLLDLSSNEIRELPPELGLMESLRALKLEGNPLKSIRQNLLQGTVSALLEFLRSKLPNPEDYDTALLNTEFSRLAATKRATAAANPFDETPVGALLKRQGDGPSVAEHPVEVVIRSGNLTQVPSDVIYLAEYLVKLDVSLNKLHTIEQDLLQRAHNLRVLMLADNKLTDWPLPTKGTETGPCLSALLHCNIARNPISNIPGATAFSACPKLKVLDLSGLRCVSESSSALDGLISLTSLAELVLVRCELQHFPPAILNLPLLTLCNLSSNMIEELPAGISCLTHLHTLDLTNNNLRGLPPMLGKLRNSLRVLLLEGNPLRSIRRTVLTSGTGPLLEYLQTRIPEGQQ